MSAVIVAISIDDGSLSIMEFQVMGRGSVLPSGAHWVSTRNEKWYREPTDENIAAEIKRTFHTANIYGDPQPQPVGFKVIDRAAIPTDRTYRNALKLDGVKVVHDMPKAREYHRTLLRHERVGKLMELDGQWMRAAGQGKKAEQDAIEAERQKWRDAPADPRIEAVQSVEELKQIKVA
jgi:hypothetical protein